MARFSEHNTDRIYELASSWKDDCLLGGRSLLWGESPVWSKDVLEAFKACFTDAPDESDDSFEVKFRRQLANEDEIVTKLATELILVYFLFPSSVSRNRKRELIQEVASWKSLKLSDDALQTLKLLQKGIGGPGSGYNMRRPFEIAFLADASLRLCSMTDEERRAVLQDHSRLRLLLDEVEGDSTKQSRDIILNLLYPDRYERIASRNHKKQIAETFAEVLDQESAPEDIDDRIFAIRTRLEELIPNKDLDFYWQPLSGCWYVTNDSQDLEPLQALAIKKQIAFYGPPGTGKTYEARVLSDRLVRKGLLRAWGPNKFFSHKSIEDVVAARTRRVQFHPGYAYEDLVRGLQLVEGGKTKYEDGVLLRIVKQLATEPDELKSVPFVVILDEMNRADLSKVLGECFSLMEDRDVAVQLAGQDAEPRNVSFPKNLYFIGTMNLIDQSLEVVDFALRRRFFWFFRGFDREQFLAVSEYRWNQASVLKRIRKEWERHTAEFETLADRAEWLNVLIARHPSLGEQYQIGHTYFCDVVSLIERDLADQPGRRALLFNKSGKGRTQTIGTLWQFSIAPLLEQYLSGVDSSERQGFLRKAKLILSQGRE